MEWISVKTKMPEIRQEVDIYRQAYGRKTDLEYEGDGSFYDNDGDHTFTIEDQYSVTHWMPIPENPKV